MRREIETLKIEDIHIGERLRSTVPESRIEALAASMKDIGLQTPISIRIAEKVVIDGEEVWSVPVLVAGRTRILAAQKLGWDKIDCFILGNDDVDAQLWEIDENLCRAGLTATEEAEHVARRKELWEARQSEQLVPNESRRSDGRGHRPAGFASDTAAKTGKTRQHVNRVVRRAAEITSEARDLIRNTGLDTGAYLDRLMKVPEDQQVEQVERDLALLAQKERSETLRREAADREREAKEAKKRAKIAVCDFLLDALSPKQWDHLIGLIEACGGTLRAEDLRAWQAPVSGAAA